MGWRNLFTPNDSISPFPLFPQFTFPPPVQANIHRTNLLKDLKNHCKLTDKYDKSILVSSGSSAYTTAQNPAHSHSFLMYEDHMDGHMGHSNASLLASADEMAGNYTPRNDNNGFPILYKSPPRSVSRDSDDDHSSGTGDVELDYPMPEKPEIWQQAEHPDSINKLLNMTGDVCLETFRGAAKMLSHANPDTFLMPLEVSSIPSSYVLSCHSLDIV